MPPEPKKQAARGQKQILKENGETIIFYGSIVAASNAIFVISTIIFFWEQFTGGIQACYIISALLHFAAVSFMRMMSRPRYASDGSVLDTGVDLNMTSGMAEHLKDIIILVAGVHGLALTSNYFWWLLALIPARAFHLLWRTILAPYFFSPAPTPTEADEKKQKKMERRMQRGQR